MHDGVSGSGYRVRGSYRLRFHSGSVITESDPVEFFGWSARTPPASEHQSRITQHFLPAGPTPWARQRATHHESSFPFGTGNMTSSTAMNAAKDRCRSYNPAPIELDLDTLSTDCTDSLREQVSRVHQRLDEVQKEVLRSKEETGESSKRGSPFTPEIQSKPLPATFRLPALEPYDGSGDPMEHVATFRSQMALYDTSEALMCRAFPTTLRGSAIIWFFWSLIERPPTTLPEMLQRAHQYMAVETLIAGKRDETKRSRGEQSRGHLAPPPKKRDDRSGLLPARPPPIPLNSTRTKIFFQIRENGLLKAPSPMKSHPERRDKRRYCRFHREYGHDTEECRDLQYQIEDLIRREHLWRYVREQPPLSDGRPSRDLSPRPQGPVEKQIDNSSGGNSSSARTCQRIEVTLSAKSPDLCPSSPSRPNLRICARVHPLGRNLRICARGHPLGQIFEFAPEFTLSAKISEFAPEVTLSAKSPDSRPSSPSRPKSPNLRPRSPSRPNLRICARLHPWQELYIVIPELMLGRIYSCCITIPELMLGRIDSRYTVIPELTLGRIYSCYIIIPELTLGRIDSRYTVIPELMLGRIYSCCITIPELMPGQIYSCCITIPELMLGRIYSCCITIPELMLGRIDS
ncbi:hypothetical protein GW17_00055653 [Ensete ventricosum]|nr:hypothetical protein GW17_00055653 [Ensete ventricosum]